MMTINVNGKEYKIKYGYRALAKSGIMHEVLSITDADTDTNDAEDIGKMFDILTDLLPRMVLAGLQKFNDGFKCDYDSPMDIKDKTDKVYDLLDDYIDDENGLSAIELFSALTDELMNNGFLSKKSRLILNMAETAEKTENNQ